MAEVIILQVGKICIVIVCEAVFYRPYASVARRSKTKAGPWAA